MAAPCRRTATSLETVWRYEIERWTAKLEKPHEVITFSGGLSRDARARRSTSSGLRRRGLPGVVCLHTADDPRRQESPKTSRSGRRSRSTSTTDRPAECWCQEGQRHQVRRRREGHQARRRYALSGTPMGGKPIKLWGALTSCTPSSTRPSGSGPRRGWKSAATATGRTSAAFSVDERTTSTSSLAPYAVRRLRLKCCRSCPRDAVD
jgi:hypothetical protein